MNNKHKELEFDKFYLCGPETMIEVVTDVLKKNVKESAIKFELFTASSHENVIQDLEGHTKITVMVDDEETTLKCLKTNTTRSRTKTRVRRTLLLPRRNLQQLFS
jgi:ring-1,2-phenylacetyl-CoA epoxidase subunit PaaE